MWCLLKRVKNLTQLQQERIKRNQKNLEDEEEGQKKGPIIRRKQATEAKDEALGVDENFLNDDPEDQVS